MVTGVLRSNCTQGLSGFTASAFGLLLPEPKRRAGSLEDEDQGDCPNEGQLRIPADTHNAIERGLESES